MLEWGEALSTAAGITGAVSALAFVAVLYFHSLRSRQHRSLSTIVGGQDGLEPRELERILRGFTDEEKRLNALQHLLNNDRTRASALLEKLNDNIDVQKALDRGAAQNERRWAFALTGLVILTAGFLVARETLRKSSDPLKVECPAQFQSYTVVEHGIGFCVPRRGWEIDRGPVDVDAADIFVRKSTDHDVGVHLHLALLPPAYSARDKHDEYLRKLVDTYRTNVDSELEFEEGAVFAGYPAGEFSFAVPTSASGPPKPTRYTIAFLTEEKILEAIRVWKDAGDARVLERMVSSLVVRANR